MPESKMAKVGGEISFTPAIPGTGPVQRYKVLVSFDFDVIGSEIVNDLRRRGELKTDPLPFIIDHLLVNGFIGPYVVN